MKLLDNPVFDPFIKALNDASSSFEIEARLECYSCKMIGKDKRLLKEKSAAVEGDTKDYHLLSTSSGVLGMSPNYFESTAITSSNNNSMSEEEGGNASGGGRNSSFVVNTRTLIYLIQTLNESFRPDYDFTHTQSEEFAREASADQVRRFVDSLLVPVVKDYSSFKERLWATIHEEIALHECDVYSYKPDMQSDPFSEPDCLWSFNYFFYNASLKRILFLSCRLCSPSVDSGLSMDMDTDFRMNLGDLDEE